MALKPAATKDSDHFCPASEGSKAHKGGKALNGSSNVTFGGKAALRQGDSLICIGSMDVVKSGSSSVFINGKAAARENDPSDHGGFIKPGTGINSILIG